MSTHNPECWICRLIAFTASATPAPDGGMVADARERAAELMDDLRETRGWHDGAMMLGLASELRATRAALAAAEQRADTAERKVRAVEEELAEWDLAVEPDGSPALMPVRGGAAVLRTRIALASHDRSRVTGN